jgi:hypothetical protein
MSALDNLTGVRKERLRTAAGPPPRAWSTRTWTRATHLRSIVDPARTRGRGTGAWTLGTPTRSCCSAGPWTRRPAAPLPRALPVQAPGRGPRPRHPLDRRPRRGVARARPASRSSATTTPKTGPPSSATWAWPPPRPPRPCRRHPGRAGPPAPRGRRPATALPSPTALVERDPEMDTARKPCCTVAEIPAYVWDRPREGSAAAEKAPKEEPRKLDDHGCGRPALHGGAPGPATEAGHAGMAVSARTAVAFLLDVLLAALARPPRARWTCMWRSAWLPSGSRCAAVVALRTPRPGGGGAREHPASPRARQDPRPKPPSQAGGGGRAVRVQLRRPASTARSASSSSVGTLFAVVDRCCTAVASGRVGPVEPAGGRAGHGRG